MQFPHIADVHVDDDDATETFSTCHGVFQNLKFESKYYELKIEYLID